MRARAQDDLDQRRGVVADGGGLAQNPFMRPVAIAPMRTGHVLGQRGRPIRPQTAQMRRHQLAAMEDFHRLGGAACFNLFAQQAERHRIEMLLDLDVIVKVHPAALPGGIFIRCRRQRPKCRPVDLLEQRASGGAPAAHRPIVEIINQRADRLVQLGQREEPPVAQSRQNPALHNLNADFHLGFVARLVGSRRDHRGAVMRGHIGVGAVDQRFVEAGPGDTGAQIVADDLPRQAADERQHIDMHANPVGSDWLQLACAKM